ncbi:DUF1905 domain-containing protein [Mucilaginibacter terrae]|uniref:DUF1905 domain-containing protein n=1 Tax=Mucilaginibacter terrae TaxID=1955052 RepID=UPI003640E39D
MNHRSTQIIKQLEKRKGGYYYLIIEADIVNVFEKKRHTRLICTIDDQLTYSCGLNHLGDGNFFIILSGKNFKKLNKQLGDPITYEIKEDPNPLGIEIPEVLEAFLTQDEEAQSIFNNLTDGKKRSIIHTINKIKDIDKQVQSIWKFMYEATKSRKK